MHVGNRTKGVAFLALAILIGSFLPTGAKEWLGAYRRIGVPGTALSLSVHRALHFAGFAALGWMLVPLQGRIRAALVVCGLALFIEYGESVAYRLTMEWQDVRDDLLGGAAGLVFTRARSGSANPAASEK
jgi:hypothetical protein